MKIYISGKAYKINFNELVKIGEGEDGIVYNYNGQALKIYHNNKKILGYPEITKERIELFAELDTSYFILPREYALDKDGLLIGTLSPIIKEAKPTKTVLDEQIDTVINSVKLVYGEKDIFNKNKVLLNDLNHNFLYNIFFYFFDSDLYSVYTNLSNPDYETIVTNANDKRLNDFFISNLILYRLSKIDSIEKEEIISNFTQLYFRDCSTFYELLEKLSKNCKCTNLRDIIKQEKIYQKIKTF